MEQSASLPFKKAVNAARFVIRSRTGAAILKTSYQQKSDVVLEKSAHLLKGIQKKEMRKLETDRSRFIKDQNGKLKVFEQRTESLTPRSNNLSCSLSKTTKTTPGLQSKNEQPMKDSEAKLNEESERKGTATREEKVSKHSQENKYNRDAVLYRRDFVPTFSKSPKSAWERHEDLEEADEKEDQGNSKRSENTELTKTKLLHHNLDLCGRDKRLEIWLNEVEVANIDRKLSSERRKRRKERKSLAKEADYEVTTLKVDLIYESSELLNTQDIEDSGKSDSNNSSLKLPRLNTLSSSPVESRKNGGKTASKSLDDPRFTRLIDSLAPSDNSLKLPKIFNKSSDRAG